MIKLHEGGIFYTGGKLHKNSHILPGEAKKNTIAYRILADHNTSDNTGKLKLKFDALASHDITYVGIIQTARASGLREFPLPYVLTNCHNSLCAVGGTINEDDHVYGLTAAKRYGGIYVPAHLAVIHAYMRETMAGCGKMLLGSDSHTRYGALGTLAIGEGGPELVKQLLGRTYDLDMPEVIAVYLKGNVPHGVGPQDVALAIIGAVFKNGYVKNRVMEFVGEGIAALPAEFRNGIDVMTTETTCLSSVWETDGVIRDYLAKHGRGEDYCALKPKNTAYYDGCVEVDLSAIEPMIALPYHPSNVYTIRELKENARDILEPIGFGSKVTSRGIETDQGVIAGCAGGTYDNLCAAAAILRGRSTGSGNFALSAYPASQPINTALIRNGMAADLLSSGVTLRTAFCGPCFGAGDVPANGALSVRHSTRNFPNREGSRPSSGQSAGVALMDARSIAATAANGGLLTSAAELDIQYDIPEYVYDDSSYRGRVYRGFGRPDPHTEVRYGPNITDWPVMPALADNLLLNVASVLHDPVTTTDELIPSGETSSYRSNPLKLAEFTLSRVDPGYVGRAKKAAEMTQDRLPRPIKDAVAAVHRDGQTAMGSLIYAVKPGDGSAREQAASCQRVLGGLANIASEYATKRYRSNLINWGMLPFLLEGKPQFETGDYIYIPEVRFALVLKRDIINAFVIRKTGETIKIKLRLGPLTDEEREIMLAGCLINHYSAGLKKSGQ
ncbi:MAG: hydratase [Eubacteriales bacterium]|nr:hydratase [Eubacteriales bacterium]